jgi:hypothetical protein
VANRSRGVYEPEALLAEVAAAVQSDSESDVLTEAAELLVAEQARARLQDRWRVGAQVVVSTYLGASVRGQVLGAGEHLVVVGEPTGIQHAVAVRAITRVEGLAPALRSEQDGIPRVQVSWARWLRRFPVVSVTCGDGWHQQVEVIAVGADHVDCMVSPRTVQSLPFASLVQATSRTPVLPTLSL